MESDRAIELKPCPFCGTSAYDASIRDFVQDEDHPLFEMPSLLIWEDGPTDYLISCGGCGAESGHTISIELAVERWNRRTQDKASHIAGLREAAGIVEHTGLVNEGMDQHEIYQSAILSRADELEKGR